MTKNDRIEFIRRFPMAETRMRDDYFLHENALYLAYANHGSDLPKDAWNCLADLGVPNPISEDISESVTNWVWWFDGRDPAINLEKIGDDLMLTLRSRKHRLISIKIPDKPPGLVIKP